MRQCSRHHRLRKIITPNNPCHIIQRTVTRAGALSLCEGPTFAHTARLITTCMNWASFSVHKQHFSVTGIQTVGSLSRGVFSSPSRHGIFTCHFALVHILIDSLYYFSLSYILLSIKVHLKNYIHSYMFWGKQKINPQPQLQCWARYRRCATHMSNSLGIWTIIPTVSPEISLDNKSTIRSDVCVSDSEAWSMISCTYTVLEKVHIVSCAKQGLKYNLPSILSPKKVQGSWKSLNIV